MYDLLNNFIETSAAENVNAFRLRKFSRRNFNFLMTINFNVVKYLLSKREFRRFDNKEVLKMGIQIIFGIFEILWISFESWRHKRNLEKEKALVQSLENLNQRLLHLENKVKNLTS